MFNLLMAWNDDIWSASSGQETFSLGRFLEYTDKTISERFEPLSEHNIALLSQYPTIFMSELKFNRDGQPEEYVTLRIGNVEKVKIEGGEIKYDFKIVKDLGRVPVSSRNSFESAFLMGRMEIHRTHWAIKNQDIRDVLAKINVDITVQISPSEILNQASDSVSPGVSDVNVVESLQEFMTLILNLEAAPGEDLFYRGHSDQSYPLVPGLFRKRENGDFKWLPKEDVLIRELLTAQAREFAADHTMLDRLVRMQHYGLPTRLLDITSNPLIALYFSCSEMNCDKQGNLIDGEVIVFNTQASDVMYYDSDKVACIANLSLLTNEQKNKINTSASEEEFKDTDEARRLLDFIRREKPYFVNRIKPNDLSKILFVRGRIMHERISSQSGAFLIFGKDAVLPETGRSGLNIKRIAVRNKENILKDLSRLNVKASTVYPGIEKTATDIARTHQL